MASFCCPQCNRAIANNDAVYGTDGVQVCESCAANTAMESVTQKAGSAKRLWTAWSIGFVASVGVTVFYAMETRDHNPLVLFGIPLAIALTWGAICYAIWGRKLHV